MSTSGTYSFGVSGYDIVRQSMLNIGKLDPTEDISAVEMKDCLFVLNMMCKQWQGKSDFAPGLKVWTRKRGHLLLSNTTGQYQLDSTVNNWSNQLYQSLLTSNVAAGGTVLTVSSYLTTATTSPIAVGLDTGALFFTTGTSVIDSYTVNLVDPLPSSASAGNISYAYGAPAQFPLLIETAVLRDDQSEDSPLRILTVQDYDYLPSKVNPTYIGDPAAILYEAGLNTGTLYTDVGAAQDVSKHIVLTYQESIQDFNTTSDEPYYPQEWYLALCWGLSEQISPMFRANWTQKQEALKSGALAIARNKGAEISSLFFQSGAED